MKVAKYSFMWSLESYINIKMQDMANKQSDLEGHLLEACIGGTVMGTLLVLLKFIIIGVKLSKISVCCEER